MVNWWLCLARTNVVIGTVLLAVTVVSGDWFIAIILIALTALSAHYVSVEKKHRK